MDRSRANKRSNTFGVQTDLESGWQQPSIPWLSYISSDSQEPSLTNNLRIRDHSFSAPSDRENSVDSTKPDFFASNFFPTRSGSSTSRLVQRRQGPQIRTNPRLQSPHRPASPSASDSRWSRVSSRPSDNRGEGYIDLTTKEGRLEICAKKSSVVHKATDDSGKNQHSHNKRKRADSNHTSIEEIDLRDVDSEHDLTRVLEQQREATVRDQQAQAEKPTKLANVTCVVCMDELTDMTATHCGETRLQAWRYLAAH